MSHPRVAMTIGWVVIARLPEGKAWQSLLYIIGLSVSDFAMKIEQAVIADIGKGFGR